MSTPRARGQSTAPRRPVFLAALLGAAIATALATAAIACGPGAGPSPAGTGGSPAADGDPTTFTLCPPGDAPPPDANAALLDVVEARLATLGVEGAAVELGTCLDVAIPSGADETALRSALFASGLPQVVAVSPELAGAARPGMPPPDGVVVLTDSTGVLGASADGAEVTVRLADDDRSVVASWAAGHPDDAIALVVDERIVGLAEATGLADEGVVRFAIPAEAGVSPVVVATLLDSGPLPGDWRQPDAPQG